MEKLLELITGNPTTVTLIIAILIVLVVLVLLFIGKKDQAMLLTYKLVLEAEKAFINESGSGHEKYEQVIFRLQAAMPPLVKIFVSTDTIDDWIKDAVEMLKEVTG